MEKYTDSENDFPYCPCVQYNDKEMMVCNGPVGLTNDTMMEYLRKIVDLPLMYKNEWLVKQ